MVFRREIYGRKKNGVVETDVELLMSIKLKTLFWWLINENRLKE